MCLQQVALSFRARIATRSGVSFAADDSVYAQEWFEMAKRSGKKVVNECCARFFPIIDATFHRSRCNDSAKRDARPRPCSKAARRGLTLRLNFGLCSVCACPCVAEVTNISVCQSARRDRPPNASRIELHARSTADCIARPESSGVYCRGGQGIFSSCTRLGEMNTSKRGLFN